MQTITTKNGEKKYREEIRFSPRNRITKLFSRKSDAKAWKRKMLIERDKKEATGISIDYNFYVEDLVEDFLNDTKIRLSGNTYSIYKSIIYKHILPVLKNLLVKEVELFHANKILVRLKKEGHNNKGINDILTVLKALLRKAVSLKKLFYSPLQEFKLLQIEDIDFNYWSKSELSVFLEFAQSDKYFNLYLVAAMTGLRRGEAAGLCWDMVCFNTGTISVRRQLKVIKEKGITLSSKLKTKTSKRTIPMNRNVRQSLLRLRNTNNGSKYVFTEEDGVSPVRINHIYRLFRKLQKGAGVKLLRYHDLRHTFASMYIMEGGDLYKLSKLMGHSTILQTEKYAHLAPEHLQGATDILELPDMSDSILTFEKSKRLATYLPQTNLGLSTSN